MKSDIVKSDIVKSDIVKSDQASYSWRRAVVGVACLVCLAIGVVQTQSSAGSSMMGQSVFLRASIALGLLWLAWPSLRRPVRWLPPAFLAIAILGIGVLIAQPKLMVVLVPLFGLLTTAAVILTWLRKFWN